MGKAELVVEVEEKMPAVDLAKENRVPEMKDLRCPYCGTTYDADIGCFCTPGPLHPSMRKAERVSTEATPKPGDSGAIVDQNFELAERRLGLERLLLKTPFRTRYTFARAHALRPLWGIVT
jgi:hypothetical protein